MLIQIFKNTFRRALVLAVAGVLFFTASEPQSASAGVLVDFAPGIEASPTGLTSAQISALKSSTFNTVVLFSITIETNGSFYYGGGGGPNILLCTNGTYAGPANWGSLLGQCKAAPSSITRIEMCIGGWLDQSFVSIKNLIAANGTNSSTVLYRNLNALKNALGLDAMDYDEEYLYDSGSAVQFGKMCASVGMKVTLCPYTNPSYWQAVKSGLGTNVDYVYLQCYSGGQGNDPAAWSGYFGGTVPVLPGDWDADGASSFLGIMQSGANEGCHGGWYWPNAANGATAPYALGLYANLINAVFGTNISAHWQGGPSDFNYPASWSGGVIPGTNASAINDSGSNNMVQINAADPAWNVNGLWAGNGTSATGAYLQTGSTVTIGNPGGWLRLGASLGGAGYYTLNAGTLNASNSLIDIGESGAGVLNLNGGSAFLGNLVIGVNSNSTGILNLNGGVLNAISINSAGGGSTSTLNFNGGTVQAAADNSNFMNGLTAAKIQAGGVVFDSQGHNITISQTLAAGTSGTGSLTKTGAGTLILKAYNTFTGPTVVNGGTLTINGANDVNSVLSYSSSLTISNGGTVSVLVNNSLFGYGTHVVPVAINAGGTLTIGSGLTAHVKGTVTLNGGTLASVDTGAGTAGTWNLDLGTVTVNGGQVASSISALNVLLATPTTFNVSSGSAGGIDLSVPGYFSSGGLVKIGTGAMMLAGTNTYAGGTRVSAGLLQLGDGTSRNGVVSGNIINNAALGFANPNAQTYSGVISGTGSLAKTGTGTLSLGGVNTYAGSTTLSNGTLALTGAGQLNQSSLIDVLAGAVLDASSRSDQTLTLSSGQTLKGSGSINGKLSSPAGSTISPGDGTGILTVQNNIVLAGQLAMELNRTNGQNCDELISTAGSIAGGGTLTVTNLGPGLQLGDAFQLFNQPTGGFSTINLPNVSPYAWVNNLAVDGTIKVAAASANPTNITAQVTGHNLVLSWPADHTGWQLQTQTNLAGTNWESVLESTTTNLVTIPIDISNGSVFFRLIYSP